MSWSILTKPMRRALGPIAVLFCFIIAAMIGAPPDSVIDANSLFNVVTQLNWVPATGSGAPSSGACTAATYGMPYTETTGPHFFTCTPTGWYQVDQPGGTAFSALTGSTNTSAAMVVGSGASLGTTGSGTIAATSLSALTGMPSQAADTVLMNAGGSGASPTAVTMPTCTSGADLYNTSTHSWSCVSAAITVASGTASMGTSAISSGACATVVTVSATGVATTDAITFNPNGDPTGVTGYAPSSSGSLYIWPYPTANNVNFKVCNNTSSSITPGALTLNWRVVR